MRVSVRGDLASPKGSAVMVILSWVVWEGFALNVNGEVMVYGTSLRGAGCFSRYSGNGGGWRLRPNLEAESESQPPKGLP